MLILVPVAGVCEQTFQLWSTSCWRCAPVASCDVVRNTGSPVSFCMASWASWRPLPTMFGMVHSLAGAAEAGTLSVDVTFPERFSGLHAVSASTANAATHSDLRMGHLHRCGYPR